MISMLECEGKSYSHRSVAGIYPVTGSIAFTSDAREYVMSLFYEPPCPKCRRPTILARITPGSSGLGIRTFKCPACEEIHQRVIGFVDPMKSRTVEGWLRGELGAPVQSSERSVFQIHNSTLEQDNSLNGNYKA